MYLLYIYYIPFIPTDVATCLLNHIITGTHAHLLTSARTHSPTHALTHVHTRNHTRTHNTNLSCFRAGEWVSSNVLLNRIQSNVLWGQSSNLMSVPTDCDQVISVRCAFMRARACVRVFVRGVRNRGRMRDCGMIFAQE